MTGEADFPFRGRTVVVTGAGSGLGRALAAGFSADGANLVGIGRTQETLAATAQLCDPARSRFLAGDVARAADVDRLFGEALDAFGRVDILVNNAALYPKAAFLDSTQEEWDYVLQTNVLGLAYCCRLALPGMLERGFGRILNIGSLAWMGPIPASSSYSVSKAAVRVLTRSLATEIDRTRYPDVLVNEVLPGIVRTRMSETGMEPAEVYPHVRFVARLPSGGPSGQTFIHSTLYVESGGLRSRLRRWLRRLAER